MHVYPNALRKQAHLHLAFAQTLTEGTLIALSGERTPLELMAHGQSQYLLRWQGELPSGMYQVAVRTQSGELLTQSMRIG